jgi:hypothetical protein
MFPCLNEMFCRHWTFQFYFLPFKLAWHHAFWGEQAVPQNYRGNFRPHKRGKIPGQFLVPGLAAHPGKDVEEFPTFAADDGLHIAIQTIVRATGNPRAVLALGAMIMISPSHFFNLAGTGKNFKRVEAGKS